MNGIECSTCVLVEFKYLTEDVKIVGSKLASKALLAFHKTLIIILHSQHRCRKWVLGIYSLKYTVHWQWMPELKQ